MKGVLQQGGARGDGVVQLGCSDSFREVSGAWMGVTMTEFRLFCMPGTSREGMAGRWVTT